MNGNSNGNGNRRNNNNNQIRGKSKSMSGHNGEHSQDMKEDIDIVAGSQNTNTNTKSNGNQKKREVRWKIANKVGTLEYKTFRILIQNMVNQIITRIPLHQIALLAIAERGGGTTINRIKDLAFTEDEKAVEIVRQHIKKTLNEPYTRYTDLQKRIIKMGETNIYTIILAYIFIIQQVGTHVVSEYQWSNDLIQIAAKYCMSTEIRNIIEPSINRMFVEAITNAFNTINQTSVFNTRDMNVKDYIEILKAFRERPDHSTSDKRIFKDREEQIQSLKGNAMQQNEANQKTTSNRIYQSTYIRLKKLEEARKGIMKIISLEGITIDQLKRFKQMEDIAANAPANHQNHKISEATHLISNLRKNMIHERSKGIRDTHNQTNSPQYNTHNYRENTFIDTSMMDLDGYRQEEVNEQTQRIEKLKGSEEAKEIFKLLIGEDQWKGSTVTPELIITPQNIQNEAIALDKICEKIKGENDDDIKLIKTIEATSTGIEYIKKCKNKFKELMKNEEINDIDIINIKNCIQGYEYALIKIIYLVSDTTYKIGSNKFQEQAILKQQAKWFKDLGITTQHANTAIRMMYGSLARLWPGNMIPISQAEILYRNSTQYPVNKEENRIRDEQSDLWVFKGNLTQKLVNHHGQLLNVYAALVGQVDSIDSKYWRQQAPLEKGENKTWHLKKARLEKQAIEAITSKIDKFNGEEGKGDMLEMQKAAYKFFFESMRAIRTQCNDKMIKEEELVGVLLKALSGTAKLYFDNLQLENKTPNTLTEFYNMLLDRFLKSINYPKIKRQVILSMKIKKEEILRLGRNAFIKIEFEVELYNIVVEVSTGAQKNIQAYITNIDIYQRALGILKDTGLYSQIFKDENKLVYNYKELMNRVDEFRCTYERLAALDMESGLYAAKKNKEATNIATTAGKIHNLEIDKSNETKEAKPIQDNKPWCKICRKPHEYTTCRYYDSKRDRNSSEYDSNWYKKKRNKQWSGRNKSPHKDRSRSNDRSSKYNSEYRRDTSKDNMKRRDSSRRKRSHSSSRTGYKSPSKYPNYSVPHRSSSREKYKNKYRSIYRNKYRNKFKRRIYNLVNETKIENDKTSESESEETTSDESNDSKKDIKNIEYSSPECSKTIKIGKLYMLHKKKEDTEEDIKNGWKPPEIIDINKQEETIESWDNTNNEENKDNDDNDEEVVKFFNKPRNIEIIENSRKAETMLFKNLQTIVYTTIAVCMYNLLNSTQFNIIQLINYCSIAIIIIIINQNLIKSTLLISYLIQAILVCLEQKGRMKMR